MHLELDVKKRKYKAKDLVILFFIIIGGIYILNSTANFIKLIPDIISLIGNLDERATTTIMLAGLSYYAYNFTDLFQTNK